ncbi:hypothetical protein L1049_018240 [Liquidambar formosana]|uniref:RanBD1 domain-containing protein n=1 Tax=Liquidambar formosana TaxID=63359 RepID=A0AAP0WMJ5_LIQFO
MASSEEPKHIKREEEATVVAGEDEDTGAQVEPIVKLQEVSVTTGEEDEAALLDLKAKLYRFDKEGNQWKERGVGTVKLLKHKDTQKVRLVMRQSKTLKICANHLDFSLSHVWLDFMDVSFDMLQCFLQYQYKNMLGTINLVFGTAADFSDGELKEELFAIRFASVEKLQKRWFSWISGLALAV